MDFEKLEIYLGLSSGKTFLISLILYEEIIVYAKCL